MNWLEQSGDLQRDLEALPTTVTLRERLDQGHGLTSPELSVLAAYAKIELATALRESDLSDDPWFGRTLRRYFPSHLSQRFDAELDTHPLRREIIATVVANDMINLGGITFAFRVMEETSANQATIARAFVALREIDEMVDELNALPSSFPTDKWSAIHLDIRRLLDRAVRWQVNHGGALPVADVIAKYRPQIALMRAHLGEYLQGSDLKRLEMQKAQAREWGVPDDLGRRWSELFEAYALLDVAQVAERAQAPIEQVAAVYYMIYNRFGVDSLLDRITALPRKDRWQALARAALRDDLYSTVADMAKAVLAETDAGAPDERLLAWEARNAEQLGRARSVFEEVNSLAQDDMASLSVAVRLLRSIVRR
jgi:glutamate dehydrogenase